MGKARIIEALGEGKYTIEVVEARERAESAKQQAEARITSLQSDIADLQGDLAVAQQAVDDAVKDMNAVIEEYQIDISLGVEPFYNLSEYSDKVAIAASERDQIAVQINVAQARIKSDEALIARVNALPPLRQMQAWCADYTDDLSGEVATAEVPGEIGKVIIKPSFAGNTWSANSDGAMQPALASTPAGTFYNLAMMPGWQKWRPTYRAATIIEVNDDTCFIELEGANSSQQGLSVNAKTNYQDVPILYMDCNAQAFELGDKVLVAFAGNVNSPIVCGFLDNPRECSVNLITISDEPWPLPSYDVDDLQVREQNILPYLNADNAGVALQGGNFTINKTINKDNSIEVNFSIQNSTTSTTSRDSDEAGSIFTYVSKSSHTLQGVGHIKFFGKNININYQATAITDFITSVYSSLGEDFYAENNVTRPHRTISIGQREWDNNEGLLETDNPPATKVTEMLEIGGFLIDVNALSTFIYNQWGSDSEWMRYFPALTYIEGYGSRGITKPYNILLPDFLPFRYEGNRCLMIVFSSTGSLGIESELGGEETVGMDFARQIMSRPSPVIFVQTEYYDPGTEGLNPEDHKHQVGEQKTHYYFSIKEVDGVFSRVLTPFEAFLKYRNEKVRGNNFDTYREIPLDISF